MSLNIMFKKKNNEKYEALDIETVWDNGIAKPICIAITCDNNIMFKKIPKHHRYLFFYYFLLIFYV